MCGSHGLCGKAPQRDGCTPETAAEACTSGICAADGRCGIPANQPCSDATRCRSGRCAGGHCTQDADDIVTTGNGLLSCAAVNLQPGEAGLALGLLGLWRGRHRRRRQSRAPARPAQSPALAPFVLMLLALSLPSPPAWAQVAPEVGFHTDRSMSADAGSRWLGADSLVPSGPGRGVQGFDPGLSSLVLRLDANFAHDPVVTRPRGQAPQAHIVRNQLSSNLGASLQLLRSLRVAALLPVQWVAVGESATDSRSFLPAPRHALALGDIRLGATYRLDTPLAERLHLGAQARLQLPTGARAAYAADRLVAGSLLVGLAGEVDHVVYAASLGASLRRARSYAGRPDGSRALLQAALGLQNDERTLLAGLELNGTTLLDAGPSFRGDSSNLEPNLGAHWQLRPQLALHGAVGVGLLSNLGAPRWRALVALEVIPLPAPARLARPAPLSIPEPASAPPVDSDGDGITDAMDACPSEPEDLDGFQDADGCPDPDNDGDGVPDTVDACPMQAGPSSNGGCPLADADGDGVADADDACPAVPGLPAQQGCPEKPEVQIVGDQIQLEGHINFETGAATIASESFALLDKVVVLLQAHPEIVRLRIEGHTDDVGRASANLHLSKQRAAAVRTYLSAHGIVAERLESEGYGQQRPLAPNDGPEARARNRRVDFFIAPIATP